MRKYPFAIVLCVALALLAGCVKPGDGGDAQPDTPVFQTENAAARQAYMDFLDGKLTVTTAERFREDGAKCTVGELPYGTYSYAQLKAAVEELEMHASAAKYAFLDFGQDGVDELALRFESTDPSFMNWVGILRYDGAGLELNYCYEDGYRSFSELYTSGYLQTGGAASAGESVRTVVGFDGTGAGAALFTEKEYYGSFAASIVYDLRADGSGLSGDYTDLSQTFSARTYTAGDGVKLSVGAWSEDVAARAREEAFVAELESLGAQVIEDAQMQELCSLAPYEAPQVQWLDWDDGSAAPQPEQDGDALSADYAPQELLAQPDAFYEFIADDSEYQVKVVFSANSAVTDLRVLALSIADANDAGEITFAAEELYTLASLTPEKPLVVGMVFTGEVPNMGVSYVDGGGALQTYAVSMSGLDGSLLLTQVKVN